METKFEEAKSTIPFIVSPENSGLHSMVVDWNTAKDDIPPYWSRYRDNWLRKFWKTTDPLKVAVYTFVSKTLSVPFSIQPKNRGVSEHVRLASAMESNIRSYSGLMRGWRTELTRFVQDYLTSDNGAFFYIMSDGDATKPLLGAPIGVYHLDSARCVRTKSNEFPVVYQDRDSRLYKLHYTRVINMANLSSPDLELNGVGLCAVSCAIDAAREEYGINRYNAERMGTRPQRGLLYIREGGTIEQLQNAIEAANIRMDAEGLSHFSRTLLMAPRTAAGRLDLAHLPLTNLPDHFNRLEAAQLNMSRIAGAFGLDTRDLAFAMGTSSTRADAEVQERKGRGKGVGEFLDSLTEAMNMLLLPSALYARFDFVDDEADKASANIREIRASTRSANLQSGVTDVRIEREMMLESGEINRDQFEDLELRDGRLEDGTDVLMLFYHQQDRLMSDLMNIGVADPANILENDAKEILPLLENKRREIFQFIQRAESVRRLRIGKQALSAFDKLSSMYQEKRSSMLNDQMAEGAVVQGDQMSSDNPENMSSLDQIVENTQSIEQLPTFVPQ